MSTQPASPARRPGLALWLPLVLFGGFLALVVYGLVRPDNREVASTFIGKPIPAFALPPASDDRPGLSNAQFVGGKPRLLNIFASWCGPCAVESPQLAQLAKAGAEIDGVAIRDRKDDLARFLAANGNPFARIGQDDLSKVQIGIGSSGVPETFVVDAHGVIRHQHIGAIMPEDVPVILAKLKEAEQ
ncbi:cytochrome c biogenesis protein CcmG/thiol:disulfide interchange protein DsbE [Novosphingobium capsulatum]|uniref:Cytochrome c biogenesis protein CcmG/thiol:disulfide interchange protein DsbE n=1 Tax=Novosphingobium capsulatum TaxID=13688 RepID=A0ABU1MNB4_9SPHN|nr:MULTISPECIES: DsbE family thiol:disulfide interchange protein [Novosphingobium]KPF51980.1 alkyl hydroperoxide reductase [Novosphingobium sp. AAP1]MBB3360302.1 cytochrome c biogenesis protein CcmG/thiol:disulfide interchange protein DsbE [Novosphingobium sp. BK256]MBB3376589.1 cytochrome c biogenesis protein CcmG/thiol:disulfide interchange protein DsbE [Novosphingobium sp. BK280]MBB3381002.1 cytochrome c biogenesis protein CcmG/thiol:disulfide interchange protein DsbE [Novosphingobium sp. BK